MKLKEGILRQYQGKAELKKQTELAIDSAKLTILNKLGNKSIVINARTNVSQMINKFRHKNSIEDKLNTQRLEEANREKEVLERKIRKMEKEIVSLSVEPDLGKTPKRFERVSKEKEQESTEFTNKLRAEQREREKRRRKHLLKYEHKLKALELKEQEEKQAEIEKKNEEKIKRLQDLQDKNLERKKKLAEIKEEISRPVKTEAIFKKKEKAFKHLLKREEEARQQELFKIKDFYRPIDIEEINSHERNYEEILRKGEKKRNKKLQLNSFNDTIIMTQRVKDILEYDRMDLAKQEALIKEKKDNLKKQHEYSQLTKQVYFPKIDKKPPPEKPVRKRLASTSPEKTVALTANPSRKTVSVADKKEVLSLYYNQPVDYLSDRRKIRKKMEENLASINHEKPPLDLSQAKAIEHKAARGEHVVRYLPVNDNVINAEDQINQMLLNSLKAKVSLLK